MQKFHNMYIPNFTLHFTNVRKKKPMLFSVWKSYEIGAPLHMVIHIECKLISFHKKGVFDEVGPR